MNRVFAWPVGHDDSRQADRLVRAVFFLSAAVGGILLGLLLATVAKGASLVAADYREGFGAIVIAVAALLQLSGTMGVFPERGKQVPVSVVENGQFAAALVYGVMLGTGALTRLRFASAYAVLAMMVVLADWRLAFALGVLFGSIRGLGPIVVFTITPSVESAHRLERFLRSPRFESVARLVTSGMSGMLVVGIVALD